MNSLSTDFGRHFDHPVVISATMFRHKKTELSLDSECHCTGYLDIVQQQDMESTDSAGYGFIGCMMQLIIRASIMTSIMASVPIVSLFFPCCVKYEAFFNTFNFLFQRVHFSSIIHCMVMELAKNWENWKEDRSLEIPPSSILQVLMNMMNINVS